VEQHVLKNVLYSTVFTVKSLIAFPFPEILQEVLPIAELIGNAIIATSWPSAV
jgi:hypothetical protein